MQKLKIFLLILGNQTCLSYSFGQSIIAYSSFQRNCYFWDKKETRERVEHKPSFSYEIGIGYNIKNVIVSSGFINGRQYLSERVPEKYLSGAPNSAIIVYDYARILHGLNLKAQTKLWGKGNISCNYQLGIAINKIKYSKFHGTAKNGATLDSILSMDKVNYSYSALHSIVLKYKIGQSFSILFSPYYEFRIKPFEDMQSSLYINQDSRQNIGFSIGLQFDLKTK